LLIALAGFERVLVDPTPGTTRDAIDLGLTRGDRRYVVVDTAGLRRKSKIVEELEARAAGASLQALDRAEVVVLVLEADAVMTDQDLRLADLVWRHGRGLVIAVNKSDLSPGLKAEACRETVARSLRQWPPLPVVLVSAKKKRGLDELLRGVDRVGAAFRRRLPTARVNDAVRRAATAVPPPLASGRTVKLMYATQTASAPPTVVVFASQGGSLAESYRRYLTHRLREEFDLIGVPLRLQIRARPRRPMQGPAPEEPRRASRGRPPAAKRPERKPKGKRVRR
jgi:GTP-binding protein